MKWVARDLAAGLVAAVLFAGPANCIDSAGSAAFAEGKPKPKLVIKPARGTFRPSPEHYDAILKKYVQGDYFDYEGLVSHKTDTARFNAFMKWQAEADLKTMTRDQQIAFYINAYNSCCIKAVLDHYPVLTPMDIDGFFDKLKFKVAGEWLTIGGKKGDSIEYDRLIKNYKDMRAHFAVVCADRGCLPLKKGAYTGARLDKDLEAAAKLFVSDERHFKVDLKKKEVHVSKLFEWYGEKFLKDPKRPVKGKRPELYLLNWITDEKVRDLLQSGDYKLKIIEWSWTLNEKKMKNRKTAGQNTK